jgi:Tfp pilus assembly protein PilV
MQIANGSKFIKGPFKKGRQQAGFTLAEVMMAFTILVAGICGCLGALQSGYKSVDTARCSTLAAQIMQSQIEKLRLKNWTEINAELGANTNIPVSDLVPTDAGDVASRFTLSQTVAADASKVGMLNITLNVTWQGVGSTLHTRSLTTRYSRNGLYDYYLSRR